MHVPYLLEYKSPSKTEISLPKTGVVWTISLNQVYQMLLYT